MTRRISWGGYREFSGPYSWGTHTYKTPENPTAHEKILSVFTATEGGKFDAINMYDRCIISVGLIQYCEAAQFSVSTLLGHVAETTDLGQEFSDQLEKTGYIFTKQIRGKWRFYRPQGGKLEEVDTISEQRRLFLSASGRKGEWGTEEERKAKVKPRDTKAGLYAQGWCSAVASVFEQPAAQAAQASYIMPRVEGFATQSAKRIWSLRPVGDPWSDAGYAAFLSFAGNLPSVASRMLQQHVAQTAHKPFTKGWVIDLLKQLTFGPGIAIYPERYNKIRPVLEALYGVDLPDFAKLLRMTEGKTFDIRAIQQKLLEFGFPLGNSGPNKDGVDGRWGGKSKNALFTFETMAKLKEPDGVPDHDSIDVLMASSHIEMKADRICA